MAIKKLTDLTALTTPADGDLLLINDVSEALPINQSKKIAASVLSTFFTSAIYAEIDVKYSTIIVLSPLMACVVGDDHIQFPIPASLDGWVLTGIKGYVNTAGSTGTMTVQIENVTQEEDMLSTLLTFASGAAVDNGSAEIDATKNDVSSGNIISVNIDTIHTTPAMGLFIELEWSKS